MEIASEVFEIIMVVSFGLSWPFNIAKAYKARTARGTSIVFTLLILFGYAAAIVSKLCAYSALGDGYWTALRVLAFVFYIINFCMLSTAAAIYFRNKKLDKEAGQ